MKLGKKMKKKIIVVVLMLVISTIALSGCVEDNGIRKFDGGNIWVHHVQKDRNENDFIEITIFSKGNYIIYVSYVSSNDKIKSKTFYFEVCNIPYQYKFESYVITDYELKILEKEYR